jgi:hypothetical protein
MPAITTIPLTTRSRAGSGRSLAARLATLRDALLKPDHWVLLSGCDWHPDANGFPTDQARLLVPGVDASAP